MSLENSSNGPSIINSLAVVTCSSNKTFKSFPIEFDVQNSKLLEIKRMWRLICKLIGLILLERCAQENKQGNATDTDDRFGSCIPVLGVKDSLSVLIN